MYNMHASKKRLFDSSAYRTVLVLLLLMSSQFLHTDGNGSDVPIKLESITTPTVLKTYIITHVILGRTVFSHSSPFNNKIIFGDHLFTYVHLQFCFLQ